jgi:RHS repeat-associated protein
MVDSRRVDANNNPQPQTDVSYTYDVAVRNAQGRLASVTFGAGQYVYGYSVSGRVTTQQFVISFHTLEADYRWDTRCRMTQLAGPVETLNYQYDAMSRLVGMTDSSNNTVASATYDQNSLLSQLTWGSFSETRLYNNLQQLTHLTTTQGGTGIMDMQYLYTAGGNNGRVAQTIDGITLDTQTFTYDALNRLTGVGSSIGNNEAFTYDGFGNMTSSQFGNQAAQNYTYNGSNQRSGYTYDANGNVTQAGQTGYSWDVENRMTSNGAAYDPWGKRVETWVSSQQPLYYFYSITGQRLATFVQNEDGTLSTARDSRTTNFEVNRYFGGKLIQSNGLSVATDRLGSVRANSYGDRMAYLAYGQERGGDTADGREKFGTYYRDGLGLDYADQRYYGQQGMFLSPDPAGMSATTLSIPGSWNRYGYALADPVNFLDPHGLDACGPGWQTEAWLSGPCGDPCDPSMQSRFAPSPTPPDPACSGPDPEPARNPDPLCFAQLKYRPTEPGSSMTHASWYVQGSDGQQVIITAGPSQGKLHVWVVPVSKDPVDANASVQWSSGLSSAVCAAVDALIGAAKAWQQDTISYSPGGPNSNTAARILGIAAGFAPTAPPGSRGWNTPL